jgi:ABC-type dipeptide/oligopeptide/nickel transport system ATPase component
MKNLLEIRDLSIRFRSPDRVVDAVKGVSLSMQAGGSLAIVGESGSGKSVTALALTRLLPVPPAEVVSGDILFEGESVMRMSAPRLRELRGGGIAYVFQEPSTSLNPVYSIRSQIAEAIRLHRPDVKDVDAEIIRWLDTVGIADAARRLRDYPHQLSGGMQQRVMIAMALSCRPKLLVADEPTTALDVTIQAQILAELRRLRAEFGMGLILITHNFAIIGNLCERVAVMLRGEVVEYGDTGSVLRNPQHPYTRALIACIPKLGSRTKRLPSISDTLEFHGAV